VTAIYRVNWHKSSTDQRRRIGTGIELARPNQKEQILAWLNES
jgi:hypothetical protein